MGDCPHFAPAYFYLAKIPDFPEDKKADIVKLYYNPCAVYNTCNCSLDDFLSYDSEFNVTAGIHELDKSKRYLEEKLQQAIENIVNDVKVEITF